MHSNGYILRFAIIVCVLCALVLTFASEVLKPTQKSQEEFFIKKKVLTVFGKKPAENATISEVLADYEKNIMIKFIDKDGNYVDAPANVEKYKYEQELKRFGFKYNSVNDLSGIENAAEYQKSPLKLPIYILHDNGKPLLYAIPIVGKGLWSTLYGYLAFEKDFNTVKGLSFYDHKETPGLGARIEEDWFQNNFKGKTIFNTEGQLVSISVKKGVVDPTVDFEKSHMVDGISGATITSAGVTELLEKDLNLYASYFKKMQSEDTAMKNNEKVEE